MVIKLYDEKTINIQEMRNDPIYEFEIDVKRFVKNHKIDQMS